MSDSPIIDPERKDEMIARMNAALGGVEPRVRYVAFQQYEDPAEGDHRIAAGSQEFCLEIAKQRADKYPDRPTIVRPMTEEDLRH